MSQDEYVWAIAFGPGSLVKYQVWDGAITSGDTRIWAPLGQGPNDWRGCWAMNDDIEFLED